MRIAIDAHALGQRKTGNETYTRELVRNLANTLPQSTEALVYVRARANRPAPENCRLRYRAIHPDNAILRLLWFFAAETRRQNIDVFHTQYFLPYNLRCRSALVVHDVGQERFPEFYTRKYLLMCKALLASSIARADHIIAVSENTKQDLIHYYRCAPERISVTYNGCGEQFRPMPEERARRFVSMVYGIEQPYILYVGAVQPRKNLPRLLAAFLELKAKRAIPHRLVIVGPKGWRCGEVFDTAKARTLEHDVVCTGYVADEDLPAFYNAADFLVYPSFYEGFGLPVVEAMACGTPVITSFGSALEEVAGSAALLIDPYQTSDLASAIERLASDRQLRAELSRRGVQRSALFSFRRMAAQTCAIFERIAGAETRAHIAA